MPSGPEETSRPRGGARSSARGAASKATTTVLERRGRVAVIRLRRLRGAGSGTVDAGDLGERFPGRHSAGVWMEGGKRRVAGGPPMVAQLLVRDRLATAVDASTSASHG